MGKVLTVLLIFVVAWAAAAPVPALAYGVATHAWLAEEDARRLAAADPSLAFLASDPDALHCFRYGAYFPDMRSLAGSRAAGFDQLKRMLEGSGFVDSVRFATDDVVAAFSSIDTHSCGFLLHLVDRARATGDRYTIAFALGNLAHVMMDKHAQVFEIPRRTQHMGCGDLGIEPAADPAAIADWDPGRENELLMEGFGDFARTDAALAFVKDAPWLLAATPTASYARAIALRRFYWEAADAYARQLGRTPPTERGIQNGALLLEVSMSFYPFFTAHEPLADAGRTFVDRFLDLPWWASALTNVVDAIVSYLLNGRDLYDLVGPLVPMNAIGPRVAGVSVIGECLFAFGHGGTELQRVRAKYAQNAEFVRMDQSGILDLAIYAQNDYELAHFFVEDGLRRGAASAYTDDRRWPRYSTRVMRGAASRSLALASGADGVADAPGVLVWDVRYVDPATGAGYPQEVALPADVGRTVRVEVELFGADPAPIARIVRLRLRADMAGAGPGAGDPVLAAANVLVPAEALDPRAYATRDRPIVAVEWTVADVAGADGAYVELDERRLAPVYDEAEADRLLSTDLAPLAPFMAGRLHYDTYYATYGTDVGSLRFRR